MRWDRLFAELEAGVMDEAAAERDALADDLRDEQWSSMQWAQLLGDPELTLRVGGLGEISGPVVAAGELLVVVGAGRRCLVVPEAVLAVSSADGRAQPAPALRRSRRQVARAVRDAGAPVRAVCRDGSSFEGVVVAAGADFVQLAVAARRVTLPWAAVAALIER